MVRICCDGVGAVRQQCVFWGVNQCRDFHLGGASCVEDMAKKCILDVLWCSWWETGTKRICGKIAGRCPLFVFSYSSV